MAESELSAGMKIPRPFIYKRNGKWWVEVGQENPLTDYVMGPIPDLVTAVSVGVEVVRKTYSVLMDELKHLEEEWV